MNPSIHNFASHSRRNRFLTWLASLFLSLAFAPGAFGLDPARGLKQYNDQTWTRQNGLPVNAVNAIVQADDGFIWLGTSLGLVRFDGIEFKLFDLASVPEVRNSTVLSLARRKEGGLWVGLANSGRVGCFDGRTFSFRGKDDPRGGMNVRSILESKTGSLWLVLGDVLRLSESGAYERVTMNPATNSNLNAFCAFENSLGRIWFGGGGGVYYWETGKVAQLPDAWVTNVMVNCLTEDAQGQLWVGTEKGLKCFGPDLQPRSIPELSTEVRALLVDRQGVLWIGTEGQGLGRYQNGVYQFLRRADGLADDNVTALAEDREGNLWVGTRDGLTLIHDVKFPTCPSAEGVPRNAWAVGASQHGGVWIGSAAGATYFDGEPKTYSTNSGLPQNYVKRIFEASNGDVYLVSGTSALVVMSNGKVVVQHEGSGLFVGITEDAQGVVVSMGGGLFRVDRNEMKPYVFTNSQPDFFWILNLMTARDGAIWVSTVNGIFRIKDGDFQHWGASDDWSDPMVLWLCEDNDGVIWAVLNQGIARLKDGKVRCITRQDGLFDDSVWELVPDSFGNLWGDSARGIFRVSVQSLNDFADGRAAHVECASFDGPESVRPADKNPQQEHVACKTSDGRIWFPGSKGVVMIDPAHIPTNQAAPPVQVVKVVANGRESGGGASLAVEPGKGELEFHFTALSFIASKRIRFRYQLEGYDQKWVNAGDRRIAFYTNLKPGRYTFRVTAANADGVWNKTGDAVTLELQPHFYQTAWFAGLCVGFGCAVLAGAYLWRVRHLNAKQRALQKSRDELETEVAHRTAELARTNVSLQSEVEGHKNTTAQLWERSKALEKEIEERKRVQREVESVHQELVEASRQAGMAEVATGVLHNVGNVLNSVNVSTSMLADKFKKSKAPFLSRVVALIKEHAADLGDFVTNHPKGQRLPDYLDDLAQQLVLEQKAALQELEELNKNVSHIKDIVSTQQTYAKVVGVSSKVKVTELADDALRMNASALVRHDVQLFREYEEPLPEINVDRHKVLQIMVNLIRNAKYACDEGGASAKRVTVRIANGGARVSISVADNGVGIPAENMTRIFNHGFTTRASGHGFGLHSGALAAKELGGTLQAHSDGPGKGATFTLELPLTPPVTS